MGDKIFPYKRKRVDSDGYIVEETWIMSEDGHSAPLDAITSRFGRFCCGDVQDLEDGKPIKDFRVRREINDYAKEQLRKFKL